MAERRKTTPAKTTPRRRPSKDDLARGGKNHLTAAAKRDRDSEVVRLRLQPMTWKDVAKATGLSDRQCRTIWKEFQKVKKSEIAGLDAVDWVVETYEFYETQIARLGVLAADVKDEDKTGASTPAKVGALNAQRAAKSEQTALLQATGFLATDLGKVREDIALREILEELLAVFDEMGVPAEVEERLFERLERKTGKRLTLPVPTSPV